MKNAESTLRDLENKGLIRKLRIHPKGILNFSTNDYLGLSSHPLVKKRAIEAIELLGTGSGGSRLMAGNLQLHEELEQQLARLTGTETSLVFGSGFLANTGVLSALAGRDDAVFADRLNHASLVDGATASRAKTLRYHHCNVNHLFELLQRTSGKGCKIVVTDSVFSMDGDIAPLREIRKLCDEFDCLMVVDEAHAIGVFGSGGGVCRELGVRADVITGTLSKALGGYGGFAACSRVQREFFINRSRSFVYSTGLPPASAGAALGAIEVIQENSSNGQSLLQLAGFFRKELAQIGLDFSGSASQIVPVVTAESFRALSLSKTLEENGILAIAVRPPTVPAGTSRLRFSLTTAHSAADILKTAAVLGAI